MENVIGNGGSVSVGNDVASIKLEYFENKTRKLIQSGQKWVKY